MEGFDFLAVLKAAIIAMCVLGIGTTGLYLWLKHTGQLKSNDHSPNGQAH